VQACYHREAQVTPRPEKPSSVRHAGVISRCNALRLR